MTAALLSPGVSAWLAWFAFLVVVVVVAYNLL